MLEFKVFFALGALGAALTSLVGDSDIADDFFKLFLVVTIICGFLITWGM